VVWQYIASGTLGNAAFEGGVATALLGLVFHLIISFVIAGVFILSGVSTARRNLVKPPCATTSRSRRSPPWAPSATSKRTAASRLAAALGRLVSEPALRAGARAIGRKLTAEDGVERAVARIEQL
jgi:hypothetical protein